MMCSHAGTDTTKLVELQLGDITQSGLGIYAKTAKLMLVVFDCFMAVSPVIESRKDDSSGTQ
jgi:hypothetical protein